MPYCPKCGSKLIKGVYRCDFCGNEINDGKIKEENKITIIKTPIKETNKTTSKAKESTNLKLAAFIMALLGTITNATWFFFSLIWCVPMTYKIYKSYKNGTQLSTGFKVCVIIFNSPVSGILLLADKS